MQLTSTISLEARKRELTFEQQHIDPTENDILLENDRKLISNSTRNIKIKYLITRFNFGHVCICWFNAQTAAHASRTSTKISKEPYYLRWYTLDYAQGRVDEYHLKLTSNPCLGAASKVY